jgi:hypothetical protein
MMNSKRFLYIRKYILNRKEVVKEIPPYFKNQSVPIVSYSYTNSNGRKIFNYKEALQDINIEGTLRTLWLVTARTLLFNTNGIWRSFLLLSWRGSDRTGLKRRKDATSHIILDNLYLGEKGSTPPPKSLRSLR